MSKRYGGKNILMTLALAGALGCSGYTDAGVGSKTLKVVANLDYKLADDVTEVKIDVESGGAHVPGATVRLIDGRDDEVFAIDERNNAYRRDIDGYHRRLELFVETTGGSLTARLEGPGGFVVTKPVHSDSVSRQGRDIIRVVWETKDGIRAERVEIRLDQFERSMPDRGEAEIPLTSVSSAPHELQVQRSNSIELLGGTGSSVMRMSYALKNTVLVTE